MDGLLLQIDCVFLINIKIILDNDWLYILVIINNKYIQIFQFFYIFDIQDEAFNS